jgi:hypothetical protein
MDTGLNWMQLTEAALTFAAAVLTFFVVLPLKKTCFRCTKEKKA